jgi:Ca-activated chloride channel family protein
MEQTEMKVIRKSERDAWPLSGIIIISVMLIVLGCTTPGDSAAVNTDVVTNCAPEAIEITIAYMPLGSENTTDENDWVPRAIGQFNQSYLNGQDPLTGQPLASGHKPICVTGYEEPSGIVARRLIDAVQAPDLRDPSKLPTLFQPAVTHWLTLVNYNSGRPLFSPADIYPVALSPVVIAIWESRLRAIRETVGYDEIGWEELLAVLTSPNGWQDYGIPDGRCSVYYGHTDPFISSTGLSTLISEFYASARANGFTDRTLTLAAVNRPDIQQGVRDIEAMVRHYARNTTIFKQYIARGPEYVDFVALPENDLININLGRTTEGEPPEPLVALYPKEGTFWHEHPFGIVQYDEADGGWTTAEQREAARRFIDFVLTPDIQRMIMSLGFRPANPALPLESPLLPEYGIDPAGPSITLDVPSPEVVTAIQNSWTFVKKQADIVLLIDVSGSMSEGSKLQQAKQAALAFLEAIPDGNRVGLTVFNTAVEEVVPLTAIEGNQHILRDAINNLQTVGGTALYSAVINTLNNMVTVNPDRIQAVVLLSDGADTSSEGVSLNDVVLAIQASQPSSEQACDATSSPIVLLPVAYGADADLQVLNTLARASRTEVTRGDVQNILRILEIIASYF